MASNQGITSLRRPMSLNESYGAMQQSVAKSNPKASQAVNQALDRITPMLNKLDNKTLGLLLQLTQYLKDHKSQYKQAIAKLIAKGSLPPNVFPENYDPKFLSVFALSVTRAQQERGMAAGGIADVAQHMKNQGRGEDTMLAHISPKEAELLRSKGGIGTLNPETGLPEFNILDDLGNGLKGVGDFLGDVLRPVGNAIGDILHSPLGLAMAGMAGMYFMGMPFGAEAVIPSVGSSLPGAAAEAVIPAAAVAPEVASVEAVSHLTPAAIESGLGTSGYGVNASAAESGLFDPAKIGSGAETGASSGLTAKDILKKGKDLLSGDSEEKTQSDPNQLLKLIAMLEMMNQKNDAPAPVSALGASNMALPYDSPDKQYSSNYAQKAADGGLMMTQRYDIGGVTADRTQTDYLTKMLEKDPTGAKLYRPGQGGITYFNPLLYKPITSSTVAPTTAADQASADAAASAAANAAAAEELARAQWNNRGGGGYRSGDPGIGSGGYTGATTNSLGDSGVTTGAASAANRAAAFLGNLGLTSLSDAIAKNVDSNYGHEGAVGLRQAADAAAARGALAAAGMGDPGSPGGPGRGGGIGGGGMGGDGGGGDGPGGPGRGGGMGGGGMGAAQGGYLNHGRFDHRMADGGIAALRYADGGATGVIPSLQPSVGGVSMDQLRQLVAQGKKPNELPLDPNDPNYPYIIKQLYSPIGRGSSVDFTDPYSVSRAGLTDQAGIKSISSPMDYTDPYGMTLPRSNGPAWGQGVGRLSDQAKEDAANPRSWQNLDLQQKAAYFVDNPGMASFDKAVGKVWGYTIPGMIQNALDPSKMQDHLYMHARADEARDLKNALEAGAGPVGTEIQRDAYDVKRSDAPAGDGAPVGGDPNQGNEGMHSTESQRAGGEGGGEGGGGDARGGYLNHGRFDQRYAPGGITALGGYNLGSYSDGGRLLKGPGDGVSDSIPATIGRKQPARLADGEFVIPARIVSELGNGSTDAGAKRLYQMMDRIQKVRRSTKNVAANTKAAKYMPA